MRTLGQGILMLLAVMFTSPGFAQNEELKAGRVRPPVANMSEEVAREKLKVFGFTNIEHLQKVGDSFVFRGMRDNQPVEVEMQAATGVLRHKATKELIDPSSGRMPLLQDSQIKMERRDLVRPELLSPQAEPK